METQVTKENYEEVLANIAAEFDLEQFTSVSARNGYPEGILPLLDGLKSEEQVNEIVTKYPKAILFEVEWKEGWQTKYRRNEGVRNESYTADMELGQNEYVWYKGEEEELERAYLEGLDYQCEELIDSLAGSGIRLDKPEKRYDDCRIAEYRSFAEKAEEVIEQAEEEGKEIELYASKRLSEIKETIDEVIEMKNELQSLTDGQVLIVDEYHSTRISYEKAMDWYDGDVTHRCIAVGFDPWFLPSEEEIEEDEEE